MALKNTGAAFHTKLNIQITQPDGTVTTEQSDILAAAEGYYSAIALTDFQQLSEQDAQARYNLHRQYLESKYAGLNLISTAVNGPIVQQAHDLCPLVELPKYTICVESKGDGDAWINEKGIKCVSINSGDFVDLIAIPNSGYTLLDWICDDGASVGNSFLPTRDCTVYAHFVKEVPQKEAVFIGCGATPYGGIGGTIWVKSSKPVASNVTVKMIRTGSSITSLTIAAGTDYASAEDPYWVTGEPEVWEVDPPYDDTYTYM